MFRPDAVDADTTKYETVLLFNGLPMAVSG
jgi:hypothetical protein